MLNEFKESFQYFFRDERWVGKSWILFVIPLIPVFGLLGLFVLKGWRFSMVSQISQGTYELPNFDPLRWLKIGVILWAAVVVYSFVPHLIASIVGVGGVFDFIGDVVTLFTKGFDAFVQDEMTDLLWQMVIFVVWGLISIPIYQAGMIRFVNNGNWKSLYNIPVNAWIALRCLPSFLKFFIYWWMFVLMVVITDIILVSTGIGALLIPIVSITLFYITTAHELGHLAKKVNSFCDDNKVSRYSLESP